VKVGLVQLNWGLHWSQHEDDGAGSPFALLPYSIGMLQAYAGRHYGGVEPLEFLPAVHRRAPVPETVAALDGADVVGFSAYVWNARHSLAIAEALKRERPDTIVVFGGPQVPDHPEGFLLRHRFVDLAVHGEGERTFTALLEAVGGGGASKATRWADLPGISWIDEGDRVITHPRGPRMTDLSEAPSPYLDGVFDAVMAAAPYNEWVATWETNRGCPFSCSFCDWGSAVASKVKTFPMDRLEREIEWFAEHRVGFVWCCDANFGLLPRDLEITEKVVESRRRSGFPSSFAVQNAKNATERTYKIQSLLASSMNTIGVTLSLQSTNEETLANIRRSNIRSESYRELQRRYTSEGVYTYTDIILALPGESYDAFADSVSRVIDGGQHNHIQFHNCSVLPNAEMGDPAYRARFGMRTVPQPLRGVYDPAGEDLGTDELLDIVVGTDALPAREWVRAKVFTWLTDLWYFDRVLQLPMVVARTVHGVSHRRAVEALATASRDAANYPVLHWVHTALADQAARIQGGGVEYLAVPEWGNLWWPMDQYVLIRVAEQGRLEELYSEAGTVLASLAGEEGDGAAGSAVAEATELNRLLLRRPFEHPRDRLVVSHDVWALYRAHLAGADATLEQGLVVYDIERPDPLESWLAWREFLVWAHRRDKRDLVAVPHRRPLARPPSPDSR